MSDSSTPKITKAEKSEKIKDPKKVEAGKRLAAISREPKERKARERTVVEKVETEDCCTSIDYKYFIGGVVFVAAVGSLYFAYKRDRREVSAASNPNVVNTADEVKPENTVNTANTKLDSFD